MTAGEDGPPSPAVVRTLSDIQEFIREGLDYFENVHSPEKKERPEFRILIGFGTLIRSLTMVGLPTEGLSGRGEGFDDWSYLRKLRDALGLSDSFLARIKAYRNATAHAEPWTVEIKSPEADSETLRFLVVEVFFALKEWSLTAKARTTSELAASFYRYLSENNSFVKRLPPAA